MRLTMLGTGMAMVTACYNTCFVLEEKEESLLVDGGGGNGVLVQMERAGIDWKSVHHIIITHKHIDHIMGILWVIRKIGQGIHKRSVQKISTVCRKQLPKAVKKLIIK